MCVPEERIERDALLAHDHLGALYGRNLALQNPKVGWRSHYLPRVNLQVFEGVPQVEP